MIRVVLVLEQCLMRSALAALLEPEEDIHVVDTLASGTDVPGRVRSLRPDVCVVELDGTGRPGTAGAPELFQLADSSKSALLALVASGKPGLVRKASQARALGYISKDASPERLLNGIRRVAAGERFIDSALAYSFLEAAEIPLTPRELTVLTLAAEGASVAEIARSLHLSNGTVRNYLCGITRKTGARNRVDAIRISRGAGWL